MLKKYKETYNPKIDFRVIYLLTKVRVTGKDYLELKSIFYQNKLSKTSFGKEFEKLFKVYNLLKSNHYSISLFNQIYNILELNNKIDLNELINKLNFDNELNDKICFIFRYILLNNTFNNYSYEMTSLIINSILVKNSYYPIMFNITYLTYIKDELEKGITDSSLIMILGLFNDNLIYYLNKYDDNLDKEKIIAIIYESKNELINQGINAVWLYGSFARGDYTNYSDVDLFVSSINNKNIDDIKDIFVILLKRLVDIHLEENVFLGDFEKVKKERILIFDERK